LSCKISKVHLFSYFSYKNKLDLILDNENHQRQKTHQVVKFQENGKKEKVNLFFAVLFLNGI
jgi:hypothetical protein